jgi:hypothetical protein
MLRIGLEHKHQRVQAAALDLFHAVFSVCPAAFDEAMVELFPPALSLQATRFPHVQAKAQALLTSAASQMPADVLLASLLQALQSVRSKTCFCVCSLARAHLIPCRLAGQATPCATGATCSG